MRRMIALLGTVLLLLLGVPQAAEADPFDGVKISVDRNFGTQAVGTTTTHTVTIVNSGDTTVRFAVFAVSSNDGAFGFPFESLTCISPDAFLDPGEICSYDITFTPLSTGTLTGTTDVTFGTPDSSYFIQLKLRGRGV